MNARSMLRPFMFAAGLALGAVVLGAPAAGADASPPRALRGAGGTVAAQGAPIGPLEVLAFGHGATLSFTTAQPTSVTVTHKAAATRAAASPVAPMTAAPGPSVSVAVPASAFGAAAVGQHIARPVADGHVLRQYATTHEVKLTGLTPNTAYDVAVVAETQSGQKHTAETRIVTAKRRVRVTLREINISKDGDWWWMDGEPAWVVLLSWGTGKVGGCYPNTDVGFGGVCQHDSRGEGRFFPRNNRGDSLTWLFAEENFDRMPEEFQISATAEEVDFGPLAVVGQFFEDCVLNGLGCSFSTTLGPPPWRVPQGVEASSTPVRVAANDSGTGFESELVFTFELFHDNLSYPSQRNAPSSTWRSPFGR